MRDKEAQKQPFRSPELWVYGSVEKITRTACPNHGKHNEPGGPFTDGPTFTGCPPPNQPGGSKKT